MILTFSFLLYISNMLVITKCPETTVGVSLPCDLLQKIKVINTPSFATNI